MTDYAFADRMGLAREIETLAIVVDETQMEIDDLVRTTIFHIDELGEAMGPERMLEKLHEIYADTPHGLFGTHDLLCRAHAEVDKWARGRQDAEATWEALCTLLPQDEAA